MKQDWLCRNKWLKLNDEYMRIHLYMFEILYSKKKFLNRKIQKTIFGI